MAEPKLIILDDAHSLYVHAAEEIVHFAGEAICMHGEFMLALSGGSTPAGDYAAVRRALPPERRLERGAIFLGR